ncbi:MAG: LUD domain-containing protein [Methanosarcinales archaeon]
MKLDNTDKIEARVKNYQTVIDSRRKLISTKTIRELTEKLKKVKEYSIENKEYLISLAKKNLIQNGVEVYEAKDALNARKYIVDQINGVDDLEYIVKSKSNTTREINLKESLKKIGMEVIETDLGDRIIQIMNEEPSHPTGPAAHLTVKQIVKALSEYYHKDIKPRPEDITKVVKKEILNYLFHAKIGITGANAIASEGGIILVHSEGNISLVSLLPEKHIAIAGIDKIVPKIEDGITLGKVAAIYAIGTSLPTYIDVITGPSKTADIEKKIVHGMYGPSEVHLILLDNGRSDAMIKFPELFRCIGCGACLTVCPISVHLGSTFGRDGYLGGRGVIFSAVNSIEIAIKNGLFLCTFCGACEKVCPCEIPIPEYIHKLRIDAIKKGLGFEIHKKIANSIMKYSNPYLGFRC